jgi:hypothetical protein
MTTQRPPICPQCRSHNVIDIKAHADCKRAAHPADHSTGLSPCFALGLALAILPVGKTKHTAKCNWKCVTCDHYCSNSPGGCRRCTAGSVVGHMKCCKASLCQTCINEVNSQPQPCCNCGK